MQYSLAVFSILLTSAAYYALITYAYPQEKPLVRIPMVLFCAMILAGVACYSFVGVDFLHFNIASYFFYQRVNNDPNLGHDASFLALTLLYLFLWAKRLPITRVTSTVILAAGLHELIWFPSYFAFYWPHVDPTLLYQGLPYIALFLYASTAIVIIHWRKYGHDAILNTAALLIIYYAVTGLALTWLQNLVPASSAYLLAFSSISQYTPSLPSAALSPIGNLIEVASWWLIAISLILETKK
jgi:hypothetical protein